MHYASHILLCCIALWCAINGGKAARSAVSPDILANFAKNVASVLSPAILGEVQSRNNRSYFQSTLTASTNLNNDDLNSHSILDNIVDKTSNAAYYEPRSYPYNGLYEDSSEKLEGSETNERLDESLRDDSYLRQEQPNFYKPYDYSANNDNFDASPKPNDNIDSSIGNIQESSTNLHSSYHGAGFPKAAFPHGPFLDKPYGGFHGFGPYGHYGHHHHPYGGGSSEEASSEENNGTNYRGYGSPYFGHPYSPFPHGGYGNRDFYGPPYQRNGNNSYGNGHNGYHHGPYGGPFGGPYGGPYGDFYGPPGYGYNHGHNGNNNGNNNGNTNGNANGNTNSRQTEEPTDNGDQNNATKNGYSPPYGPPWVKPLLGTIPLHGFPPFSLLPYDHFHGVLKGGPVAGVGHAGYPIYADPYFGFSFHQPYGPFLPGKKYLPKGKPADSGESAESTEAPAELSENENPERITALNNEEVAQAPSSNRYKTSGKRINLVNFQIRRV